jgi:methyl-accepting chemotaxis protein
MAFTRNLSVGTKIIAVITFILFLLAITDFAAISGIREMQKTVSTLVNTLAAEQQLISDLVESEAALTGYANQYLVSPGDDEMNAYTQELTRYESILAKASTEIKNPDRAATVLEIQESLNAYKDGFKSVQMQTNIIQSQMKQSLDVLGPSVQEMIDRIPTTKDANDPRSTSTTSDQTTAADAPPDPALLSAEIERLNQNLALDKAVAAGSSATANLRLDVYRYFIEDDVKVLDLIDRDFSITLDLIDKITDVKLNTTQRTNVTTLQQLLNMYRMAFDDIQAREADLLKIKNEKMDAVGEEMRSLAADVSISVRSDYETEQKKSTSLANEIMLAQIGMLAIAIVIGLAAGLLLVHSIRKPLAQLTLSAREIAEVDLAQLGEEIHLMAEGDLTRSVSIRPRELPQVGNNEIGRIAEAFNTMICQLQAIGEAFNSLNVNLGNAIGEVAENASGLGEASERLATASAQASQATSQITLTIQQVAQGTSDQSNEANHTAAAMEQMNQSIINVAAGAREQEKSLTQVSRVTDEMSVKISQVAENATAVKSSTKEATQAARQGARTVEDTINGMNNIRSRVNQAVGKIQGMGSQSVKIGDIVDTIDDIASQTNLLALNAAIEAARAGEHGKGFAVVADEVRKLAEKSAGSTREIGSLIKGIRKSIDEAIQAMNESSQEVEAGVNLANKSGAALNSILAAIEAVNTQAEQAEQAAHMMNTSAEHMITAVNDVAKVIESNMIAGEEMTTQSGAVGRTIENIVSVSEENSAAVEEVSASAEEVLLQVEEVSSSAQILMETAKQLQALVGRFQLLGQETHLGLASTPEPPTVDQTEPYQELTHVF